MKINKKKSVPVKKFVRYDRTPGYRRAAFLPLHALVLALIVESLSRGSVIEMLNYVVSHPFYFGYNALLILTTLTFSELFRHRKSVLFTLSVTWLGLGVAALMVVRERTQPFTSMDILMLGDAVTLTTVYYTWTEIILMCAAIFAALALAIWIISRLPARKRVNRTPAIICFVGLVILCFCLCTLGVSWGYFPEHFENLVDSYNQYGFATCFTFTFGDMGVSKPEEYTPEVVSDIMEEIEEPDSASDPRVFSEEDNLARPNIVYVQLESLFDVNTIIGAEYSEDPTPNFNRLSRQFPSGELYVPAIGGGTANVEFEMLTGMNLEYFGVGEYPYSTVLQEKTCETIAYNLLEQGYSTTAMHNHTGTFYSRNEVYSRLGFEHFVSLEYMPYATYSDLGWCEDRIMVNEITKALDATEERDFVFAITVESHGKYEDTYTYTEGDPEILALPEQLNPARFSNYLHLIHATDAFVGELVSALTRYDEPTVVVFYGDHLPGLDFTADILTTGNLYASRYVIWNNFGAEFEAPDLQAYRVSANLLRQLDLPGGVMSRYHQSAPLNPEAGSKYFEKLELLEYDLLYGDQSAYENGPYAPVELTMGSVPIAISSVSNQYGRVLVNGQNFTEYSKILIDGEPWPTAFVSSTQVIAIVPRETPVTSVCVAQMAIDGTELGRTADFILSE